MNTIHRFEVIFILTPNLEPYKQRNEPQLPTFPTNFPPSNMEWPILSLATFRLITPWRRNAVFSPCLINGIKCNLLHHTALCLLSRGLAALKVEEDLEVGETLGVLRGSAGPISSSAWPPLLLPPPPPPCYPLHGCVIKLV